MTGSEFSGISCATIYVLIKMEMNALSVCCDFYCFYKPMEVYLKLGHALKVPHNGFYGGDVPQLMAVQFRKKE